MFSYISAFDGNVSSWNTSSAVTESYFPGSFVFLSKYLILGHVCNNIYELDVRKRNILQPRRSV
ncbi:hypothetical protein ACHAXM_002160 [Skeletonema potamos]